MKWLDVRLRQIEEAITTYNCKVSLSDHLKEYFRKNPKMGGRDRKQISAGVYDYFRVGRIIPDERFSLKISAAIYLCEKAEEQFFIAASEHLGEKFTTSFALPIDDKIKIIKEYYPSFEIEKIFPSIEFSPDVNREEFWKSFLIQPHTFIRIKREHFERVKSDLRSINIQYEEIEDQPFALRIMDKFDAPSIRGWQNGFFEIQDLSSQKICSFFEPKEGEHWWDCCAGSGGKTLALTDKNNRIKVTATDIRFSILKNFESRVDKSEFYNFVTRQADITKPGIMGNEMFDNIIADVPCTGSGTWARTPEAVHCFDEKSLSGFNELQFKISLNASAQLKKGGKFYYITCSVFKSENEDVVDQLISETKMKLLDSRIIEGYKSGADSLFVAILEK